MADRWFMKADLDHRPQAELNAILQQARDAIGRWVRLDGGVGFKLVPRWETSFSGLDDAALSRADDPVVVKAVWKFELPAEMKHWRVCAPADGRFALVVRYGLDGQWLDRVATLFPSECARWLELPSR